MKPEKIAITRKFNLGNYQTMDIHVEASIDENEDTAHALKRLEALINDYWQDRTNTLVQMAKK